MSGREIYKDSFRALKAETNEEYLRILEHKNEKDHAERFRKGETVAIGGHIDIAEKSVKLASPKRSLRMRIFQERTNHSNER